MRKRYHDHPDTPDTCICGATEGIQLHHLTYERLGAELPEDLHPLCGSCHRDIHVLEKRKLMDIRLEGYASDLRRSRYARERQESKARSGDPDPWHHDAPYSPANWRQNSKQRFANTRDRREEAKKLARRLRAA